MICGAALAVSAIILNFGPGIDFFVSKLFYLPGRGFSLDKTVPLEIVRTLGIGVTIATITGLVGLGVWWRLHPEAVRRWPSARPWADWLFLTASMAIGPGILVNLVIKPIWGRARPRHILEFGGAHHFTPAWVISDQCKWGCSFVSGEAAATFMVLAFCFVVPQRWRRSMLIVGCLLTFAISLARIAVGGHFLSDVVTAWLLMGLVMLVVYAQVYHGALLGPFKRWLRVG